MSSTLSVLVALVSVPIPRPSSSVTSPCPSPAANDREQGHDVLGFDPDCISLWDLPDKLAYSYAIYTMGYHPCSAEGRPLSTPVPIDPWDGDALSSHPTFDTCAPYAEGESPAPAYYNVPVLSFYEKRTLAECCALCSAHNDDVFDALRRLAIRAASPPLLCTGFVLGTVYPSMDGTTECHLIADDDTAATTTLDGTAYVAVQLPRAPPPHSRGGVPDMSSTKQMLLTGGDFVDRLDGF